MNYEPYIPPDRLAPKPHWTPSVGVLISLLICLVGWVFFIYSLFGGLS